MSTKLAADCDVELGLIRQLAQDALSRRMTLRELKARVAVMKATIEVLEDTLEKSEDAK